MEAQYGKFLDMIRAFQINVPLIDVLAGMPNYGKFLKELISNKHKIKQISAAFLSDESSAMIYNKVPLKLGDPESFLIPCNFNKTFSCNALADLGASINLMPYSLYAKLSLETLKPTKMSVRLADRSFQYPVGTAENMVVEVVIRVKQKQLNLGVGTERMIFNIDSAMKHSYLNDDTCFSIDVIDEIIEEDFNALLDECSKILHSIEGTLLEEEIFAEFDEFMAITADENSDSESDTEEPPFEKITINTDYKIKTSLEEPPTDLKLKPLPDNLEYVFLEEPSFLPVIISSQLTNEKKNKLVSVLKKHKQAFAWKTTDIPGICPSFCKHKIQLLDDKKPVVQKQRRLNPNMQEVVKKEIMKLLDTGIIYPIADSPWVSPIHCVPKKGGITVVTNENDELVPTRTVTGWRVCIDYRKLNEATTKDHFPLPFMDQMLERLAGNKYFCFLDGFSGYFQIPIDPNDQEKTTFTCPFGTYAYRRMHFGLCNVHVTLQSKIMERTMKRYGVNHHFFISYHPQTSGQVENTNRALKRIIEKTVKDNPTIWSGKLDDALWAFRTAYKTPTDDEPMWAADHVVAPTPGSTITIPEIANEFAIKGSSNTDTDKIMAQMDAMIIKMDAQYKELQSHANQPTPDLNDDDMPMSYKEEAKFMQTFCGNSKAYQPPQARNEHVNVVFTRSGKTYKPPDNMDDQQNNLKNPINFDSIDEDDESTP
ncbi:reverse transcriptase domain-containing protein [Tanacetum coccineum]